ncbi:MAG TPA: cupin domain-containing protein, partial [Thermoanaerobaculia bacterium]|nr:cupin domain-containing protein [Thermoanaerobaculia bacterium]
EKPDVETAAAFLAAGRFLWNAGTFLFRVDLAGELFARHLPATWAAIRTVRADLANLAEVYAALPAESIDYGIMEKLPEHVSIPLDAGWSDVGSWDEVARFRDSGAAVFERLAEDNFVVPLRDKVYGLVGVEGLIVVDTDDALLVARRGASEEVKALVDAMKAAGRREATEHPFEHRPWGDFEVLRDTPRFKSKILRVLPGQQLSYQSHRHRSEHWIVVAGRPEVVLDDAVHRLAPGDHIAIPQGARHRIRNPGGEMVEIVEVQLGSYFGEDDIVRYEDDYQRA